MNGTTEIPFSPKKILAALKIAGTGVAVHAYSDLAATVGKTEDGGYAVSRVSSEEIVQVVFPPGGEEFEGQLELLEWASAMSKPPIPDDGLIDYGVQGELFDETPDTEALVDAALLGRILAGTPSETAMLSSSKPGVYDLNTVNAVYTVLAPPGWSAGNLPSFEDCEKEKPAVGVSFAAAIASSLGGNKKTGHDKVMLYKAVNGDSWIAGFDGETIAAGKIDGEWPMPPSSRVFMPARFAKFLCLFNDAVSQFRFVWDSEESSLKGNIATEDKKWKAFTVNFQFYAESAPQGGFPDLSSAMYSSGDYEISMDGGYMNILAKEILNLANYAPSVSGNEPLKAATLTVKETGHKLLMSASGWLYDRGAAEIPLNVIPDWEQVESVLNAGDTARWVIDSKSLGCAAMFASADENFIMRGREDRDSVILQPCETAVFVVTPLV